MRKLAKIAFVGSLLCLMSFSVLADLNDGLVAYYPFDGNANDESGNGNEGDVDGATLTVDRFGNTDSAYRFDGESSVTIGDIDIITSFTMSIWFNTERDSKKYWIINKTGPNDADNYALLVDNGNLKFSIKSGNYDATKVSGEITKNSWHHGLMTWNGNKLSLYIDGSLEDSSTAVYDTLITNNFNTEIGFRTNRCCGQDNFYGKIDDFRIYNRTLSKSEIQELYNGSSNCEGRYDEGYNDGYAAGIAAGGAATYDIWSTILTIPSVMVGDDNYSVELQGPYNIINAVPTN